MLRIEYLNHASVLIDLGEVRLLIDPWFEGTAFEGGWGLRYRNDKAYEAATRATHLWISHFHSDHFHVMTLKKILALNPGVQVLGNRSYNFQLDNVMGKLGFANVTPLRERKALRLTDAISVTRYPTTGIDNVLLIDSPEGRVLNYNDCVLPPLSRKVMSKKFKEVDIFMTNFNHAGKLLVYPPKSGDVIREKLKDAFHSNYEHFSAKHIFPFASHHYYRAPESADQNDSMLHPRDLLTIDKRILDINIGDTLTFDKATGQVHIDKVPSDLNPIESLVRKDTHTLEALQTASKGYVDKLRKSYGIFTRLLSNFYIYIQDLDVLVNLDIKRGIVPVEKGSVEPHIMAHSEALHKWFSKIYGTDSFVVGAHFAISQENKLPLKWQIVFGMLIDNKLDIRSMLGMFFSLSGLGFILNRREEIVGILLQRKIAADYHD